MVAASSGSLRALREHPFDLLREMERRAKVGLAGGESDDASVEEWVGIGFRLGTERFIVGRDEVREILMVPSTITRVPGAKPWVRGLANVRGHLLPISDLRAYLGAGAGGMSRGGRVLVLNGGDFPVGLIVDEVFGFRRFLDRERSDAASDTAIRCDRYLEGSFARGEEAWPVFSTRRLLAADEFCRAAAD